MGLVEEELATERLEQQAPVAAVAGQWAQAVLAVQVSSSSAIQTHSEQLYLRQVHQRLLWLEAFEFTHLPHQVLLLSNSKPSILQKGLRALSL